MERLPHARCSRRSRTRTARCASGPPASWWPSASGSAATTTLRERLDTWGADFAVWAVGRYGDELTAVITHDHRALGRRGGGAQDRAARRSRPAVHPDQRHHRRRTRGCAHPRGLAGAVRSSADGRRADPRRVDPARSVPQAGQPDRLRLRRQGADDPGAVTVNGEVETRRGRQLVGATWSPSVACRPASLPADRDSGQAPVGLGVGLGLPDPSADVEQVHHEDQGLAGCDHAAGAAVAVRRGAGGMTSRRRPPTFMPWTPWSQPEMTWPTPRRKSSGAPRLYDASNSSPGRVGHADVVHRDGAAGGGLLAVTLGELGDLEVTGRRAVGEVDLGLVCSSWLPPCHGCPPATRWLTPVPWSTGSGSPRSTSAPPTRVRWRASTPRCSGMEIKVDEPDVGGHRRGGQRPARLRARPALPAARLAEPSPGSRRPRCTSRCG